MRWLVPRSDVAWWKRFIIALAGQLLHLFDFTMGQRKFGFEGSDGFILIGDDIAELIELLLKMGDGRFKGCDSVFIVHEAWIGDLRAVRKSDFIGSALVRQGLQIRGACRIENWMY